MGMPTGSAQRARTTCPQGHMYDDQNTRITPAGFRKCMACDRERQAVKRLDPSYQEKMRQNERERRIRDRERINAQERARYATTRRSDYLVKRYGITKEDYDQMFINQGGVCGICQEPPASATPQRRGLGNLVVDHDHTTGRVRGLLCHDCNKAVGLLHDSADTIHRAAKWAF